MGCYLCDKSYVEAVIEENLIFSIRFKSNY